MELNRQSVSGKIARALIDLMADKPFIDITVTDVVKKAGVARASFYRNFSSTSEVLDMILDDLVNTFKKEALPVIASQDEAKWRAFLLRYIHFAVDNKEKVMMRRSANASLFLYRAADAARELSRSLEEGTIKDKYRIPSRIGVINSVFLRWIDDGRKESPEEIVDYLMGFILTI